MLSHFEQFTLSIHDGKGSLPGWKLDLLGGSQSLEGKLDQYFFNHLASVTTLSLKDLQDKPLELSGRMHGPLILKVNQMPSCEEVAKSESKVVKFAGSVINPGRNTVV